MSTLKFKCTLLTDVILNQKAASEGPNETLDFIPGSNFLGITASKLYREMNEETMNLFHSGVVRFGDAHPSVDGMRGLKIPASMFYPKLGNPSTELYIHHAIPKMDSDELRKKQLKQCRNGFYKFADNNAVLINIDKNFAIKSAYDKIQRRSKDEQMYGYQSLQEGLVLYFEVEVQDEALVAKVRDALAGKQHIGRSRTAQYGLVEIAPFEYNDVTTQPAQGEYVTVYADSRLIFLDETNGLPTLQPTAQQLGLLGEICWEKSQILTFQYAPWNFQRQCFDTDRCGIEKGSVFVVKANDCPKQSQYVGSYKNEGFGKVIYNPSFLEAFADGKAKIAIVEQDTNTPNENTPVELSGTKLLDYLATQQVKALIEQSAYEQVEKWASNYAHLFTSDTFASQWGTIRRIAMQNSTKQAIQYELFDKCKEKNDKKQPDAYLTHGVAADKWKERGRLSKLQAFVNALNDQNAQIAMINLASEMAKKCRKEK